jgi:hypothetical protein
MLASDVITSAFRRIGKTPMGGVEPASYTAFALKELSDMLQHWAAEGLLIHALTTRTHVLTPGTASYTIGSGGAINVQRPVDVRHAMITGDRYDSECRIEPSIFAYQAYRDKTTQGRPNECFYDPTYLSGLASISLYPAPNAAYTLTLKVLTAHVALALATDTIVAPPEYDAAMKVNLAVRLMMPFSMADPLVLSEAAAAKSVLMRNNVKRLMVRAQFDAALLRTTTYDITTGI